MRVIFLSLLLAVVLPVGAASRDDPEKTVLIQSNAVVQGSKHMVVAANPHAAKAGMAMLAAGGTAMDAAVAIQSTLNLVEPQSSGIGGGTFILYYSAADKKLYTLDARETAPAAATADMFMPNGEAMGWWDAIQGGLSVGVPGVVKGLEQGHQRFGKLPWQSLFDPAIDLSERGFEVSPRLASLVQMELHPSLKKMPAAAAYFYPNGEALKAGQVLKNPQLAASLKAIAKEGSKAFYEGDLAKAIVDAVAHNPIRAGRLSLEDLANYQPIWREPLCANYRQQRLCGMAPPSSGGLAVLQIMGMLAHFELSDYSADDPELWHLFTEAARIAYADRQRYAADADFVDVPVAELLDPAYLTRRAKSIDINQDHGMALPIELPGAFVYANDNALELPSTSHFVVVDQYGNALSATTSIEMGFGSSLMVGGFLLNNQLTDFSLSPMQDGKMVANRVEPGKRPRSSMAPMMVFENDKPSLLLGSPGGTRIINYVVKTMLGVLDLGLDIQQAINLPNISQTNGKETFVEKQSAPNTIAAGLRQRGHIVVERDMNSGVHAIQISGTQLWGGADQRREGMVITEH